MECTQGFVTGPPGSRKLLKGIGEDAALGNAGWNLLFAIGLLNPSVLLYVALRMFSRQATLRLVLAVAAIGLIGATWIFLGFTHSGIRIGYAGWAGGIVMMVSGEIRAAFA